MPFTLSVQPNPHTFYLPFVIYFDEVSPYKRGVLFKSVSVYCIKVLKEILFKYKNQLLEFYLIEKS